MTSLTPNTATAITSSVQHSTLFHLLLISPTANFHTLVPESDELGKKIHLLTTQPLEVMELCRQ